MSFTTLAMVEPRESSETATAERFREQDEKQNEFLKRWCRAWLLRREPMAPI